MAETEFIPMWLLMAAALALLVPVGAALIMAGRTENGAGEAAQTLAAAFTLAVVGYFAVGFALHFGGVGLLVEHSDLEALVWEWSALSEEWGANWGMAGAAGFGLAGAQTPVAYLLLLSALPMATTATFLAMAALRGRAPALVVGLFGALTAFVGYPLLGNWIQGGGWLSKLAINIGAGRGYIDFGMSSLFLLAGGVALASMLAFSQREMVDSSEGTGLLSAVGAGLLLVGSSGWLLSSPLVNWADLSAATILAHALLAAAGGGLIPMLYTWIFPRRADSMSAARGVAAGWVAGLASVHLIAAEQALLIGAIAGLLALLVTLLIERLLRWQDPGGIFATFGIPALWGILALGIFADIPGQLEAQAIGAAVIFWLGFLAASIVVVPLALIARAWAGRGVKVEEEMVVEPEQEIEDDPADE